MTNITINMTAKFPDEHFWGNDGGKETAIVRENLWHQFNHAYCNRIAKKLEIMEEKGKIKEAIYLDKIRIIDAEIELWKQLTDSVHISVSNDRKK